MANPVSRERSNRPVRAAALGLAVAAGVLALSPIDAGASTDTTPPSSPTDDTVDVDGSAVATIPPGDAADLAATCSAIIDERDPEIGRAAMDASIELVYAAVENEPPSDATAEAWTEALSAWRAELEATHATLSDVEASDPQAWAIVLDAGQAEIDYLDERIAALGAEWGEDGPTIAFGGAEPPDGLDDALAALGQVGRDCEVVWGSQVGAAGDEWLIAAAAACRTILDRRAAGEYEEQTTVMLEQGMMVAMETGVVEPTPELVEAVDALLAEWQMTATDLRAVAGEPNPDAAAAWQLAIEYADERVDHLSQRAEALQTGDADAFLERSPIPGYDWRSTPLEYRDCRSFA